MQRTAPLGWFTLNPTKEELCTVHSNSGERTIASGAGGTKYFLKEFPQLSPAEKRLLEHALDEFRSNGRKPSEQGMKRCLKRQCIVELLEVGEVQRKYLLKILKSSLTGFGAIDSILQDAEIEEIALIDAATKPVYVFHKKFGWLQTNLFFEDEKAVCNLVNRMAQNIGRRLTFQSPSINAVLPDGSRIHAAINPVAFSGPCFTIRKFSKKPFTPSQLIKNNTITAECAAFLWMALEADCSMLVAGNTGSGKTTTLNALFSFVPKSERIIVAEETPEIRLAHEHVVKLNVVPEQGITMQSLITDTLRMRPDRILVGEIRTRDEMGAFIDTLLAGQGKGSYATFHSQSSEEVVKRTLSLGVSAIDLATIDLVLVQRRWDHANAKHGHKEQRHVTELSELLTKGAAVSVNLLFEFNFAKNCLEKCGESSRVLEKMQRCFSKNPKQLGAELKKREKFLRGKGDAKYYN